MMLKLKRLAPMALLVTTCLAQLGCYNYTEIRPSEVPKLSGASTVGFHAMNPRTGATVEGGTDLGVVVETPEGRRVRIAGDHDVLLTVAGATVEFEDPVDARIEGADLVIAGGNRADQAFQLDQVKKAEVRQISRPKTTALVATITTLVLAGIGLGVVAASH